jgi:hypothetical protein
MDKKEYIFKIDKIDNEKVSKSWEQFSSYKRVKGFIVDIYLKYDKDEYDKILRIDDPNDNTKRIIDPKKIVINNLEQLTDYKDKKVINICSFTYNDLDSKYHTSILIGISNRIYLLHNYDVNKDAKEKKIELLVCDFNIKDRPINNNNKLTERFYFFIKHSELFDFCYTEKIRGSSNFKHIKFNDTSINSILDYTDAAKPFINFMSNPVLNNSYLNDKYIGSISFNKNEIKLFNMYGIPPPVNPFSYIDILKTDSNYEYKVFKYNQAGGIVENIFTLSYSIDNNKPTIKLTFENYSYEIKNNLITKNMINGDFLSQIYNINRKYIPLNNKSTYISVLITLALKFTELKDSNKTNSSIKDIIEIGDIYNFSIDDIVKMCGYFSDKCDKEYNFIDIITDIADRNSQLFNFNTIETYNIIIDGIYYNVYSSSYEKVVNNEGDYKLNIKITDSMKNIDINKLLDKQQISYDISNNDYYYYDNNDITKKANKIENNNNIIKKTVIENINNYLLINFETFDDKGKIINENLKFDNILKTLHFNNKILIPNFAVLFVGNSLDSGYYTTLQYYNNNWYVYDHKNRYEVNYISDTNKININNSQLVSIIYKSYNGSEESIYKNLVENVLFDKFDNDYTVNYYLNPVYELLKYKEAYIYDNYKLEEVLKIMDKSGEEKYEINSSEKLPARDLFVSIDKEKNETSIINLHTPNFVDDYIETNFNIKKTKVDLTNTLKVLEST